MNDPFRNTSKNRVSYKSPQAVRAASDPATDSACLVLSGCKEHPHRTDLACCKIRRPDGSALSISETWAEIQRLRAGLEKIVQGGYAIGADVAHPAIGVARDTLDPLWREKAQRRVEKYYPQSSQNTQR